LRYTLAAVRLYSQANSDIFEESYQTLSVHRHLGDDDDGVHIIDVKWMTEVVGMAPFRHSNMEARGFSEYFLVEKMSLVEDASGQYHNDELDDE
jgi:acyl-coenzyme A synthetase/AMP-(fatty) acid ligase